MKKLYLIFTTLTLLLLVQGCKKDLPFPTDTIKRGVVIDLTRAEGTDGVLFRGDTEGNFKVEMKIPEQQGDYSFMKHAQLFAVLERILPDPTPEKPTNTKTVREAKVISDNITTFPSEISLNMKEIYAKFGLDAPEIGETLYFTTNAVLKDGYVVEGWSEQMGFNNKAFTGWRVDGRAYSYNVRYSVVCELVLDDFIGTSTVTYDEWSEESPYDVEIVKVSDTELEIIGLFPSQTSNSMKLKVNPVDYSIVIDKQVIVPNPTWWAGNPYKDFALAGSGTIDACETIINFSVSASVNLGNFGGTNAFIIEKKK